MSNERDHKNSIAIHAATGTCGQGDWQCIGYYGDQHIAAFGFSPQEALDKAMTEMESRRPVGPKPQQVDLEDMFG